PFHKKGGRGAGPEGKRPPDRCLRACAPSRPAYPHRAWPVCDRCVTKNIKAPLTIGDALSPFSLRMAGGPCPQFSAQSPRRRPAKSGRRGDLWNSRLLQIDRLVDAAFVERGAPDLVRGLVLGPAEVERGAEAEIDIAHGLERVDELLGVELGTHAF